MQLGLAAQCLKADILFFSLGLDWDSISECVEWMVPFVRVARKAAVKLKSFKKVAVEDRHNIQTHTNYLDMLVWLFFGVFVCISNTDLYDA